MPVIIVGLLPQRGGMVGNAITVNGTDFDGSAQSEPYDLKYTGPRRPVASLLSRFGPGAGCRLARPVATPAALRTAGAQGRYVDCLAGRHLRVSPSAKIRVFPDVPAGHLA